MRTRRTDGLALVDKPAGMTSHDVVAIARRALGERQIGHGGTLDPFATGLLVLLVGNATRLLRYLDGEPKVYEATIQFGAETDTDDLTGTAVREAPAPAATAIDAAIAKLTGAILQQPPTYSAKQAGGRRAHSAARAGNPIEIPAVAVNVHGWEIRQRTADSLAATITCAGGTYVRALARDLGRLAGSAAHLTSLRRVRSGPFSIDGAVAPAQLTRERLLPSIEAVASLPAEQLDAPAMNRASHGAEVDASVDGDAAALVGPDGALIGIAERRGTRWQPTVVLQYD